MVVQLNNFLIERVYYVKNSVIYNIGGLVYKPDSCGVVISADTQTKDNDKIDKIYVNNDKYFLDILIEDGDKYESNTFSKLVHGENPEVYKGLFDYYKYICDKEIRKGIIDNANLTYEELVVTSDGKIGKFFDRLGVPEFMVKQTAEILNLTVKTGKTSAESTAQLIDLTKAEFNKMKKEETAKKIDETAQGIANSYGFTLSTIYDTVYGKLQQNA